jgi:hypothetical protein
MERASSRASGERAGACAKKRERERASVAQSTKMSIFGFLLTIFSYYTSPLNPLVGIDHLKLGKIYPHLNEFQKAIHHIREAGDVLKLTHGDQSRLMRDLVRPLLRETQIMLEESQKMAKPADDEEEEEEAQQ